MGKSEMLLYNIYFYNEYVDCADSGYCQSPFFKIKRLTLVKQNAIFRLTDVERTGEGKR
jgi:hypothetical protein